MKASICKIMVSLVLVLSPVKAMYEEEALRFPQARLVQHSINIAPQMSYKEDAPFETLLDELFVSVFRFLDINDLGRIAQVSTRWKRVTEDPVLWRYMGARYYGDYLSEEDLREDPKQQIIYHYLSAVVNTKTDLREIESLVSYYRLDLYVLPFKKHIDLSIFSELMWASSYEVLIVQGHQDAMLNRILYHDWHKDWPVAASESLVEKGNQKAIERKIEGLIRGCHGYTKDLAAARQLNELLARRVIQRLLEERFAGLVRGEISTLSMLQ